MSSARASPERPERPLLPPALWALIAALGSCRALLAADPSPAPLAVGSLVLGLLVTLSCAALARSRGARAWASVASVGLALSCAGLACALELARQAGVRDALGSSAVSAHELTVEGDMREGDSGWRGRARVDGGGAVWLLADERLVPGDTIRCVGRFEGNAGDEWGASSRAQGLAGTVRVVRVLDLVRPTGVLGAVGALRSTVLASLDAPSSDARALVAGSICGDTTAMAGRGLDEVFAACGTSHLVAVSGGHLVLVGALASLALARLRLPPAPRAVALLLLTGAFVTFCGLPVSAVRAWAMTLVSELSRLAGRRAHPLSSASAVALAMALADPGVTGQLGYLLSVSCVCGICALVPYVRYALDVALAGPGHGRGLAGRLGADALEALSLTLVSQAVTMPLTCSAFGMLSLVAPLANVLLAPLFSALLALGLVAAALVWAPPLQVAALWACEAVGGVTALAARALAGLPGACVAVEVGEGVALAALALGIVALLVVWPRVSRRALLAGVGCAAAFALAWHLRWRLFAPACVRVLDVGQGDAILVTDGPTAVLVDTGPGSAVTGALARSHVTHLDAVVLTHLHADHAGGLEDILATFEVGRIVVPEGTDAGELAGDVLVEELGYAETLFAGGFSLRAVSPLEPAGGAGNEGSLELLLAYDEGGRSLTALLAADAEREETGAAVERGDVGDVDLLKVGHHGSAASVTPEIAAALDPEVSVASAGEDNSYGHPDPACVDALEAAGSLFLCTIECGDVCVEPGEEGPVVSCQRGAPSVVD